MPDRVSAPAASRSKIRVLAAVLTGGWQRTCNLRLDMNTRSGTTPGYWVLVVAIGLTQLGSGCAKGSSSDGSAVDGGRLADSGSAGIDANFCPSDPCDLLQQCGCGATQVCDLGEDLANAGTACRDVTTPGMSASNCSTDTECARGYSCFYSSGEGQCRKYCNDSSTANDCGDGGHCRIKISYNSDGDTIPGVTVCTKKCKPEATEGNSCPSSPQFGCRLGFANPDGVADNDDEFWYTDCSPAPATGGGHNATCDFSSDCASGFICTAGDPGSCRRTCIVSIDGEPAPNECPSNRDCVAFSNTPTIGGIEYGQCVDPPA